VATFAEVRAAIEAEHPAGLVCWWTPLNSHISHGGWWYQTVRFSGMVATDGWVTQQQHQQILVRVPESTVLTEADVGDPTVDAYPAYRMGDPSERTIKVLAKNSAAAVREIPSGRRSDGMWVFVGAEGARFDASSMATPSSSVLLPDDLTESDPGRWLVAQFSS
jgi:hypothetical protein